MHCDQLHCYPYHPLWEVQLHGHEHAPISRYLDDPIEVIKKHLKSQKKSADKEKHAQ